MMNLGQWTIDRLAERCQTETDRFRKSLDYVEAYCFELFRRAFDDSSSEALASVYQVYFPFVMSWVHRHPSFDSQRMVDEHAVSDSMSQFIYNMRRKPFQDFANVSAIMAYLKKCVHTAVIAEYRQQEKHRFTDSLPEVVVGQATSGIERQLVAGEIWERIVAVLEDDDDVLLARLVFLQDLPPRDIANDYAQHWADPNAVRVARQRVTRKLKRDPILMDMLDRSSAEPS